MNKIITFNKMAKIVLRAMKKSGLDKALENASLKDREKIIKAMANMFGARFP